SPDATTEGLADLLHEVVMRRREFPGLSGHDEWQWTQLAGGSIANHPGEVLDMVFDLIESRELMVVGMSRGFNITDTSGQLVLALVRANPQAAWAAYVQRVEAGSWILPMQLRGWFAREIPPDVITEWVGSSLDRARLVASVISVGDERPSAVAETLLDRFAGDDEIEGSLYGEFLSGAWTGPESARLTRQIELLEGWREDATVGPGMRAWAATVATHLIEQRRHALEREAERGY
ncbi:MAG TPA: hypothetical protein VMU76_10335, partial [Acidimicrobiales bacterium]|nr:hypothetical protein [Acidimicrobiales bacterium]